MINKIPYRLHKLGIYFFICVFLRDTDKKETERKFSAIGDNLRCLWVVGRVEAYQADDQ